MSKMHLNIGLDDIATGTGKTKGWTFLVLPQSERKDFDREAATLLQKLGRGAFHGKEYSSHRREAYRDFLRLTRKYIGSTLQGRAVNCLYPSTLVVPIATQAQGILASAAKAAGLTKEPGGQAILNEAGKLASPLYVLTENTDWLGPDLTMSVELDSSDKVAGEAGGSVTVNGETWTAMSLLRQAMNDKIRQTAERTPTYPQVPVTIVNDERSFLVQAADVFGNFSMAYVAHKLGVKTKGVTEKAEIITEVFGDLLEPWSAAKQLSLGGDNDLVIEDDHMLKVVQRWYMTTPPSGKQLSDFLGATGPETASEKAAKPV